MWIVHLPPRISPLDISGAPWRGESSRDTVFSFHLMHQQYLAPSYLCRNHRMQFPTSTSKVCRPGTPAWRPSTHISCHRRSSASRMTMHQPHHADIVLRYLQIYTIGLKHNFGDPEVLSTFHSQSKGLFRHAVWGGSQPTGTFGTGASALTREAVECINPWHSTPSHRFNFPPCRQEAT